MKKPENPNKKLELVIKDSDLPSLSKDFAEVAVDGIMDDGVLRDLPLVGGLVGLVKFGNSINKYISAKKIYKFLFELHHISQEKRVKKIDEINGSNKYQSSVGEMIFELLERIESEGKPEIVGKLFAAVIEEKIDYRTYLKAAHIIKKIFLFDLIDLKQYYDGKWIHGGITDEIYNSGIVDIDYTISYEEAKADWDKNEDKQKKHDTTLTDIGNVIINIGMK